MRASRLGVVVLSLWWVVGCGAAAHRSAPAPARIGGERQQQRGPRADCLPAHADRAGGTRRSSSTARSGGAAHPTRAAWSSPVTIASNVGWSPLGLRFTGDGHAVVSVDPSDGASTSGRVDPPTTRILAAAPDTRRFREVGRARLLSRPVLYASRGIALLRVIDAPRRSRVTSAPVRRLGVSLGSVTGSLGSLQPLARVRGVPRSAALASSPRGDLAAAWVQPRGQRFVVRVALRRPGQGFGRPSTLAAADLITGVALAYGARGDLVIAIHRSSSCDARDDELAASVLRPGRGWGALQPLGPSDASPSIAVAVSRAGAGVVAWGTQATTDGAEVSSPFRVRAALLRSGADRFSKMQLLDRGPAVSPSVAAVSAAIAPSGSATVAWSGLGVTFDPANGRCYPCPVLVATARRGARFGAAEQLAANGAALGIVTADDETATVLWGRFARPKPADDHVESLDQILASRRAPGAARFALPRALSRAQPTVNGGAIALDARTQRPAALWIAAPHAPLDVGLFDPTPVDAQYASVGQRASR